MLGLALRHMLPDQHLQEESRDTIKLGAGMVATVSALVLGLLVASAKTAFDTTEEEITQRSAKIVFLDRLLADYGPETKDTREQSRRTVAATIEILWPEKKPAARNSVITIILDMTHPLQSVITVPDAQMRNALELIGK